MGWGPSHTYCTATSTQSLRPKVSSWLLTTDRREFVRNVSGPRPFRGDRTRCHHYQAFYVPPPKLEYNLSVWLFKPWRVMADGGCVGNIKVNWSRVVSCNRTPDLSPDHHKATHHLMFFCNWPMVIGQAGLKHPAGKMKDNGNLIFSVLVLLLHTWGSAEAFSDLVITGKQKMYLSLCLSLP